MMTLSLQHGNHCNLSSLRTLAVIYAHRQATFPLRLVEENLINGVGL